MADIYSFKTLAWIDEDYVDVWVNIDLIYCDVVEGRDTWSSDLDHTGYSEIDWKIVEVTDMQGNKIPFTADMFDNDELEEMLWKSIEKQRKDSYDDF